jgi:hypothetical protein
MKAAKALNLLSNEWSEQVREAHEGAMKLIYWKIFHSLPHTLTHIYTFADDKLHSRRNVQVGWMTMKKKEQVHALVNKCENIFIIMKAHDIWILCKSFIQKYTYYCVYVWWLNIPFTSFCYFHFFTSIYRSSRDKRPEREKLRNDPCFYRWKMSYYALHGEALKSRFCCRYNLVIHHTLTYSSIVSHPAACASV